MEYFGSHSLINLALCITIGASSSHALSGRWLDRSFPHQTSSCDFESPCSWALSNRSSDGDGDWRVTSPRQHMAGTPAELPAADHSSGGADGHFLVLTAVTKASGNCRFYTTSPALFNSGPQCQLQLARYQAGRGNLTVQVKSANSDSVIAASNFGDSGHDGTSEQWEVLEFHIGQMEEPFQVVLLYSTCGADSQGTLAIDSLELKDCDTDEEAAGCLEGVSFHCDLGGCVDMVKLCDFHRDCPLGEDEGPICDAFPPGSHCSFESGPCGWSVSSEPSSSSWTLVSGEQVVARADPLGSTLQNTEGHFLFLTVRDNSTGGEALVQSPSLPPTIGSEDCQVQFSLYLYGEFNGTVLLSVVESGTAATPLVWERSGNWKDSWQDVTLPLSDVLSGFHISVKAEWGPGSRADVALDQISLGASCLDHSPVFLRNGFPHEMDSFGDPDFIGRHPEPSALEVSFMAWWFTSCGASGPRGPTQAQCDSTYRNTNLSVTVGKDGLLKGVQMWRVPATDRYMISAYGAAGGKGAKNHKKRSHGVFISATFPLDKGDVLYILVGHQGEDACPGRNPLTQKICLGESSEIEDGLSGGSPEWAGGGGGGGGATYIYRMENGVPVPLLIAAGGGGMAYLEDPRHSLDPIPMEQLENDTTAPCGNGKTGSAGGGGGWEDTTSYPWAGKSLQEGAEGGSSCPQALSKLAWVTFGGFGGGGGACTSGGGGGGYRGGDAAPTDDVTAGGEDGVSFVHPIGEIFLQPLAAMESHGEVEIKVQLNCSHCQSQSCKRDEDTKLTLCLCHNGEELAGDNVTCTAPEGHTPQGHLSLPLILAVVASTVVTGIVLTCASLTLSKRLFQFCVDSVPSTFHRL